MSWEESEMNEHQIGLEAEREKEKIVDSSATEIATSVQALLKKIMADEDSRRTFWDESPEGKKRYMATLLHEVAKKLGVTPDEIKECSLDTLW